MIACRHVPPAPLRPHPRRRCAAWLRVPPTGRRSCGPASQRAPPPAAASWAWRTAACPTTTAGWPGWSTQRRCARSRAGGRVACGPGGGQSGADDASHLIRGDGRGGLAALTSAAVVPGSRRLTGPAPSLRRPPPPPAPPPSPRCSWCWRWSRWSRAPLQTPQAGWLSRGETLQLQRRRQGRLMAAAAVRARAAARSAPAC